MTTKCITNEDIKIELNVFNNTEFPELIKKQPKSSSSTSDSDVKSEENIVELVERKSSLSSSNSLSDSEVVKPEEKIPEFVEKKSSLSSSDSDKSEEKIDSDNKQDDEFNVWSIISKKKKQQFTKKSIVTNNINKNTTSITTNNIKKEGFRRPEQSEGEQERQKYPPLIKFSGFYNQLEYNSDKAIEIKNIFLAKNEFFKNKYFEIKYISTKDSSVIVSVDGRIFDYVINKNKKVYYDGILLNAEESIYYQQCNKCLLLEHTKKNCRYGDSFCHNCGQIQHKNLDPKIRCKNMFKCRNCGGGHRSTDIVCPKIIEMKIKNSRNIDYNYTQNV